MKSVPPALWIVVDDGSTDETPAILESYRAMIPYLRVIRRNDLGGRSVGPESSKLSMPVWIPSTLTNLITSANWTWICRPPYFELLIRRIPSVQASCGPR
jgi:hypothetical protein